MDRQKSIFNLNRLLATYFVFYVKLHRYIWYVKGAHTFTLQSIFNQMIIDFKSDIDQLALHILAIGGKPFATMVKFIKEAAIKEASADDEEEEIVKQIAADLEAILEMITEISNDRDNQSAQFLYRLEKTIQSYTVKFRAFQRE